MPLISKLYLIGAAAAIIAGAIWFIVFVIVQVIRGRRR